MAYKASHGASLVSCKRALIFQNTKICCLCVQYIFMRKIGIGSSSFLNEVRALIRLRGMSLRTEKTYIYWIRNFSHYNNYRRPRDMGSEEVMNFPGYPAVTEYAYCFVASFRHSGPASALRVMVKNPSCCVAVRLFNPSGHTLIGECRTAGLKNFQPITGLI